MPATGTCPDPSWHRRGEYCYLAVCDDVTQPEAQQACQEYVTPEGIHGNLVSIEDDNENLFVDWVARSLQTKSGNTCSGSGMWLGRTAPDGQSMTF